MTEGLKAGVVIDKTPNKYRERNINQCISIKALEGGYILNRDGSMAVGFETSLFEEDTLDSHGFEEVIYNFSTALTRLPFGTVVQKMDIYYEEPFHVDIEEEASFFLRKPLEELNGKNFLRHKSFLFIRFFSKEINSTTNPLGIFNFKFKNNKDSYLTFESKKRTITSYLDELTSFLSQDIHLRRLSDEENKKLIYQFASHAFDRNPICFDSGMVLEEDTLAVSGYLKSVSIKKQPKEVSYSKKNNLGKAGVSSGFLFPITHFIGFPHIISQQIEIIDDKSFLRSKINQSYISTVLKFLPGSIEKAEYEHEKLVNLTTELADKDTRLVKFSTSVFVWHPTREALQKKVNDIKTAFAKSDIFAEDDQEHTGDAFFSSFPGGCGFFEGMHMPVETAVAHLNFITPRKRNEEYASELLYKDRHGNPIFRNSFNEDLDNQHAFVFGASGSGKSYDNAYRIMGRWLAGHTVFIIESGGTYRNLFKALGGKYIEYDSEKPLALNPFLVPKEEGKFKADMLKKNFLVGFIAKIWKGDLSKTLLEEERVLLLKAITTYYNELSVEEIPSLRSFCKWLPMYVAKDSLVSSLLDIDKFLMVLEEYTEGDCKDHFNSSQELEVDNARLICFELKALKQSGNRKLYALVVNALFDYVFRVFKNQPDQIKFIDIEEGWAMLDEASIGYLETFFREGRKEKTAIRIVTQDIKEIKSSTTAETMKTNADTFILLGNKKKEERDQISAFLGLTDFDREKYDSLARQGGYQGAFREVLVKEGDDSFIDRVELSLYQHAIITSKSSERNRINKLIEKNEGDIELAVCDWVNEISRNMGNGSYLPPQKKEES